MVKKVVAVVYAGNLHFRDYEFEQGVITIGRRPDNDIYLEHASVSGTHARIDLRAMTVTDLNSTNGTFCGGQKIGSVRLQYGKPITIEPYHITISDHAGTRSPKHTDTLVLSHAELAAYIAADDDPPDAGKSAGPQPSSSGAAGWLGDIPRWVPIAFLAVMVGVVLLLIVM